MIISRADVADAEVILDLQRLAYQSEAAIYNDYSIPPLTQTVDQMRMDFDRQVILQATIEGRIVGSVRAYIKDGTCYIGRLIVHPDFQNRGIGTALMNSIEQHFAALANRYELFTGERSERNLYLYQKLGYRIIPAKGLKDETRLVFLEKRR
jgi:ribosomal protein S18 acetylase RimI-like enzyme